MALPDPAAGAVGLSGLGTGDELGNTLKSGTVADGEFVPELDRYQGLKISHQLVSALWYPPPVHSAPGAIDRLVRSVTLNGGQSLLFDVDFEDLRQQHGIVLAPEFLRDQVYDERKYKASNGTFHAAYFMYPDLPE